MTELGERPNSPSSRNLNNSYTIIGGAFDASSSFLILFEEIRRNSDAESAPGDKEQDLLRAMLVFACAGLDSMLKQLVRDALGKVIDVREGANLQFKRYTAKRLSRQGTLDQKFLAEVLTRPSPRDALVEELTSKSLQSKDQILRTASYFDIESYRITSNPESLDEIFQCRNQISHELDVDLEQTDRYRRSRQKETMIKYTKEILELANKILLEVDDRLGIKENPTSLSD